MADCIDLTSAEPARPNKRSRRNGKTDKQACTQPSPTSAAAKVKHAAAQAIDLADEDITILAATDPVKKRQKKNNTAADDITILAVEAADLPGPSAGPSGAPRMGSGARLAAGMYRLDACSCTHNQQELTSTLVAQSQSDHLPVNLSELVPMFKCPAANCHKQISYRDLYRLLGPTHTHRVLAAVAASAERQANARNRNVDITCTSCKAKLIWVRPPSEEQNPTLADIKAALQLHQQTPNGKKRAPNSVQAGLETLETVLPHAVRCCMQCPLWQHTITGAMVMGAAPGAEIDYPGKKACELQRLCYNLRDALRTELAETKKDARNAGQHKGAGGFVKGTGYGGGQDEMNPNALAKKLEAAKKRQQASDKLCTKLANNIARTLNAAAANSSLVLGLPMDIVAVVCASPHLALALMMMLGNDSLMDIASRQDLYMALLKLLRIIATHHALLSVMVKPLDDCEEEEKPTSANDAGPSSAAPSRTVLSVMETLHKQASVYVKTLNAVGKELSDDPNVVSMAMDIITEAEAMQEALSVWRAACQQEAEAMAPSLAAARAPTGESAAAREQRYLAELKTLQFANKDLLEGHYYAKNAAAIKLSGEQNRKRMLRLVQEVSSLSTDLPLCWDTGVFLAVDENRPDVMRALIFPTPETPYAYGAFLFDILLGSSYPDQPPNVILLTTGSGRVRFNPNLYNCGKVCLSLLGTWSGPSWQPGVSTLLQVLLSIQSMIFVPDPYFNEPSYERSMGTAHGTKQSEAYNAQLHPATMRYAILPALELKEKAYKPFEDVLKAHYRHHRAEVKAQCVKWSDKYPDLKDTKQTIEELLNKL